MENLLYDIVCGHYALSPHLSQYRSKNRLVHKLLLFCTVNSGHCDTHFIEHYLFIICTVFCCSLTAI